MKLWDITNSISEKKYIEDSDEFESVYTQYQINHYFSMFIDCIFIINEVNKMGKLTNRQHYDFLYNIIRKQKRYGYIKKDKPLKKEIEELMYISEVYNTGLRETREIDKLLTEEQKEYLQNIKGTK